MKETEFAAAQLRARVVTAWLAGTSQRQIAAQLRISTARVRRIIDSTPEAAEERANREQQAAAEQRAIALDWSHAHLGHPLSHGAATLGMTADRLRRLLGVRSALHPPQRSRSRRTGEEILSSIRQWVVPHGMSSLGYQAAAREHGWPSLATITERYGSWSKALFAAGFTPEPTIGRPQQYTDDQLVAMVTAYFAAEGTWSPRGLRDWLNADPARPSMTLLRKRIGPWRTLTRLAGSASSPNPAT